MLLVCTPTIDIKAGVELQAQVFLACGGYLERTPQAFSSHAGFVERTSATTASRSGGFNEFATENAWAVTAQTGFTARATPTAAVMGGFFEALPSHITALAGFTSELIPVPAGGLSFAAARPTLLLTLTQALAAGLVLSARRPTVLLGLDAELVEEFFAWVLNPSSGHARYDNFPFTGLVQHNGKWIACGPGGLYLLEGDDDSGEPILASIKTGITDCNDPRKKRAEDLYLTARSAGILRVALTHDEETRQEHDSQPYGSKALEQRRVKLGRSSDLDFNTIQVEITNPDGGDFEVLLAEFTAEHTKERRSH